VSILNARAGNNRRLMLIALTLPLVTGVLSCDSPSGRTAQEPPTPSGQPTSPAALSTPPAASTPRALACPTKEQFWALVKDDIPGGRMYGNIICADGWATAVFGASEQTENSEHLYYLLDSSSGEWKVYDYGTEGWLFDEKPLCQRVPPKIKKELCP
jgi:hypothetical protein